MYEFVNNKCQDIKEYYHIKTFRHQVIGQIGCLAALLFGFGDRSREEEMMAKWIME